MYVICGLFLQSNQSTMIAPCCSLQTHIPPALSFTSCDGISTLWDKATSFIWALIGGAPLLQKTLARKWCLHSLAFRPAINSPVCSAPLSGASGNKGSLICSSRMLQAAVPLRLLTSIYLSGSQFISCTPKRSHHLFHMPGTFP